MFELGPILDVAIGMAFVFVLFALLVSTIFEAIASVFKLRTRALENTIINMIENPQPPHAANAGAVDRLLYIFRAEKRTLQAQINRQDDAAVGVLFTKVYTHPLVGGGAARNRPSYVSSGAFASALLYVLREGRGGSLLSQIEQGVGALPAGSSLREALETIIGEAQGDFAKIHSGIEKWFDTTMARLSGAYKRFTQPCNLAIGLVIAIACNINAIDIAGKLYAEPGLRSALAASAAAYVANGGPAGARGCGVVRPNGPDQVQNVCAAEHLLLASAPSAGWAAWPWSWSPGRWLSALAGWVITALAGMMGGPFWFDSLQKLVNLRGAGPKPKSSLDTTTPIR